MLSSGEARWAYWCKCDPFRADLVESLSSGVSIDELERDCPECLHILALKRIIQKVDAIHDISPEQEFDGIVHL